MRDRTEHQRTERRVARWAAYVFAAAAALSGAALLVAPASAGAAPEPPVIGEATDEGDVAVATSSGEPATNGGSTTPFRLLLPDGAACPGDTASGNWLVQTFLIPEGDDPGAIEYGFSGPEGTQFPLYALDTTAVAHQVTQLATTPDGGGVINALPDFSFAIFPPGYIPPGEYTIGVACEYYRTTARYWDAPIVIEANPGDQPAQLTWRLPDADAFEPDDGGSSPLWWLVVAGVLVAGVAAVAFLRRRLPISPVSPISPISPTPPTPPTSLTAHRHDDRLDPA